MSDTSHVDPLGRTVVLRNSTWEGHILIGHPEIAPDRDLVGAAIESPIRIEWSARDADGWRYYGRGPRPGVMMHVAADVVLGIVKTAFLVERFSGGVEEWPSPTP